MRLLFIKAFILLSLLCYLLAEGLSLTNSLDLTWPYYVCLCFIGGWLGFELKRKSRFNVTIVTNRYAILLLILLIIPLAIQTLLCPSNEWDCLSYHLPRIEHWLYNGNIYPYPTFDIRQVIHPPLAEYIALFFYKLLGNDLLVNFVQFFSMLGCLCIVSCFSETFNIDKKGQLFVAFVVLCIPMGLYQSTTSQTDYIPSFFLMAFIYFGYKSVLNKTFVYSDFVWMFLSLFFGGLAKYTMLVFAFPFCLWFGVNYIRRYSFKQVLNLILLVSLIVVVVIGPFMIRNYQVYGFILGPESMTNMMSNGYISGGSVLSNMTKNIALNITLPVPFWNEGLLSALNSIHSLLGISIDDPSLNLAGETFELMFHPNEVFASNPFHLFLLLITFVLFFVKRQDWDKKQHFIYLFLCVLFGFILYSGVFRWQKFGNRLLLPFLIEMSFVCALYLYFNRNIFHRWIQYAFCLLLLLYAFVPVFFNPSKPVVPLGIIRSLTEKPKTHLKDEREIALLKAELGNQLDEYYVYANGTYTVNVALDRAKMRKMYALQDSLGLFTKDKKSIFAYPREERYLFNYPGEYEKMMKIIEKVPTTAKNIIFRKCAPLCEYPYWVILKKRNGDDIVIDFDGAPAYNCLPKNRHSYLSEDAYYINDL